MSNSENTGTKKGGKIGRWFRELGSELKKVTWPTAKEVIKQTGVVLVVVLFFILIVFGIDSLLGYFYNLVVDNLSTGAVTANLPGVTRFAGGIMRSLIK